MGMNLQWLSHRFATGRQGENAGSYVFFVIKDSFQQSATAVNPLCSQRYVKDHD
jgi:hypothetical protein